MLQLEGENYIINSDSNDFANRQKSIFDQLDNVKLLNQNKNIFKAQCKKFTKTDRSKHGESVDNSDHKGKKINTKHFKGKVSIFKKPEIPPPRNYRQTIPDFRRNPHKWKRYSLCDVSEDDMSDKSNTAAAMAFLNEIKSNKSGEDEPMQCDEKIMFKQPVRPKSGSLGSCVVQLSKEDSPGEDGTSYFRGSKLIMPEYVVGEKNKKIKSKKDDCNKEDKSTEMKEIKLNHLTEFDDGSDEDQPM